MNNIDNLVNKISEEIKNENTGHTEFQIRNFIIGSQSTLYGKYKQCVIELKSRTKSYKSIKKEIDNIKDNDFESLQKKFELENVLENIEKEIIIFNNIFEEIKSNIDLSDRNKLEKEYWNKKFEDELLSHWLINAPIPVNLVKNIMNLPQECSVKQKLLDFINVSSINIELKEDENGKKYINNK